MASPSLELELCKRYARSFHPNDRERRSFVHRVVSYGCKPARRTQRFQQDLDADGKMRFILMDWLVEVADLKSFRRETMYMAMSLVDRYLARCPITRKTLQLLGIACMVISARFMEAEVITIREAAWLTDNTYTYEQIVRTIGQTIFAVNGCVWNPTVLDYLEVFLGLAKAPPAVVEFAHYLSESQLLNEPMTSGPPALVAAAITFTALRIGGCQDAWPHKLVEWTGVSVADFYGLVPPIFDLIVDRKRVTDHRDVELRAVIDRYMRSVVNQCLENYLEKQVDVEAFRRDLHRRIEREQPDDRGLNAPTPTNDLKSTSGYALRLITNVPQATPSAPRPKAQIPPPAPPASRATQHADLSSAAAPLAAADMHVTTPSHTTTAHSSTPLL